MSYRITTPVDGYSGDVVGVAFVDGQATTDDEAAVAYFRRHGYTVSGGDEDQAPATVERPARNASTDAWRAYAIAQGMTSDEAAAHTRDELVALYDGVDG
ncbi:hypothetical protein [Actinomadura miaoliensis]|uniref:Lsr2 family protein n=1 Tax=Actinomadura miaoliensis TaxID=430685 RepID=A0ABP7V586_9ACTN